MTRLPARFLAGFVILLATVWAGAWTAQLFWRLWPVQALEENALPGTVLNRALLPGSATGSDTVDMEALLAYRWFAATSPAGNTTPAAVAAVETRLALRLQGAIPSSESGAGSAIIAAGERQSLVSVGEAVAIAPPGVRLAEVFADRVVLDNNGRRESLWLYAPSGHDERGEQGVRPAAVATAPEQQRVREVGPRGSLRIEDFGTVQVVRDSGRFVGVAIGDNADAAALAHYGLRVGDVVTAIDGQALTGLGQASAAVQALANSEQAELGLLRDGEPLSLTLRHAP